MDPIEINAGAWYLRALRADDRVSDVPALAALTLGAAPEQVIADAAAGWAQQSRFTWASCQPTTGELFALISVVVPITVGDPDTPTPADLVVFARPDIADSHRAARAGVEAVVRFARAALDLSVPEFSEFDINAQTWNSSEPD